MNELQRILLRVQMDVAAGMPEPQVELEIVSRDECCVCDGDEGDDRPVTRAVRLLRAPVCEQHAEQLGMWQKGDVRAPLPPRRP